MANLRRVIVKLQTALFRKGIYIKVNQVQTYSEKCERMVTKYMLIQTEKVMGHNKNTTILETSQLAEVAKCLATLYQNE